MSTTSLIAATAATVATSSLSGLPKRVKAPKVAKEESKEESKEAKVTKERELCGICADAYTPILRRKITCTFCSKDTCTKCIEHYLLGRSEDAHCIHCRVNYSDAVLRRICTKTYLQQTYFRHRQEILINRERANLPALQTAAQRERKLRESYEEERRIRAEIEELKVQKHEWIVRHSRLYLLIHNRTEKGEDTSVEKEQLLQISKEQFNLKRQINEKKKELNLVRHQHWRIRHGGNGGGGNGDNEDDENGEDEKEEKKEEKRKFIRRCMKANCQGFLSTAWKCGICENYSCAKCFTVKGPDHDSEHTCKKEDLETAELIRADSKPCPNCGEFINKSSGCFAKDTPILLWDGGVKLSQDIREGDVLVGDDGQPRTVLGTMCGVEELYEVSQTNGMTYTVNGGHTLVLKQRDRDSILEMTVKDYLELDCQIRNSLAGYRIQSDKIHLSELHVKPVGLGEFYGWQVDGNHRFLLKDGTLVHNCSQMFCITCRTPWDWNTGKVVTHGVIHNPHYYEWLKRNGGDLPRNPADIPCGGYPAHWELRTLHRNTSRHCAQYFFEFHRICMELQDQTERQYRSHIDQNVLQDTHVRFLLADFDEKEWGRRLAMAEKRRKRDAEIQEVFAAFRMVAVELINRVQHYRDETVDTFTLLPVYKADAYMEKWNEEVQALMEMANEGLKTISCSYSCQVPLIMTGHVGEYQGHGRTVHYSIITHKETSSKKKDMGYKEHKEQEHKEQEHKEQEEDQELEDQEEEDQEEEVLRAILERSLVEK